MENLQPLQVKQGEINNVVTYLIKKKNEVAVKKRLPEANLACVECQTHTLQLIFTLLKLLMNQQLGLAITEREENKKLWTH